MGSSVQCAILMTASAFWVASIRVPAAMCGLAGLRPTLNRYPDDGVLSLTTNKLDQVGCVARTVADLALFDRAVTDDSATIGAMPLTDVRIGVSPFYQAELDADVERVVKDAFWAAARCGRRHCGG